MPLAWNHQSVAGGKFEGQLFVLVVIFAHVNMETVRRDIMERAAGDLWLFASGGAAADIAIFHHFLFDLDQIVLL